MCLLTISDNYITNFYCWGCTAYWNFMYCIVLLALLLSVKDVSCKNDSSVAQRGNFGWILLRKMYWGIGWVRLLLPPILSSTPLSINYEPPWKRIWILNKYLSHIIIKNNIQNAGKQLVHGLYYWLRVGSNGKEFCTQFIYIKKNYTQSV